MEGNVTKKNPALKLAFDLGKAAGEVFDESWSPPDTLYHYTDATGLIGILRNGGEFWATEARAMNDRTEYSLGQSSFRDALSARSTHVAAPFLKRILDHPACAKGLVFLTCFSANGDLLSQWRAYADDGAGFAIGFNTKALRRVCLASRPEKPISTQILPVEYDEATNRKRTEALVAVLLEGLEPFAGAQFDDTEMQFLAVAVRRLVTTDSVLWKNPGFREECESRMVFAHLQDLLLPQGKAPELTMPVCDFRRGRFGVTPYLKLRLPPEELKDSLAEIVIGPRAGGDDVELHLRALLANCIGAGWASFPLRRAEATYR